MTWRVEIERRAARELCKLDRPVQNRILEFLRTRVATSEDPRRPGRALAGPLSSVWRYRIGDYRLFCAIEDVEGCCARSADRAPRRGIPVVEGVDRETFAPLAEKRGTRNGV